MAYSNGDGSYNQDNDPSRCSLFQERERDFNIHVNPTITTSQSNCSMWDKVESHPAGGSSTIKCHTSGQCYSSGLVSDSLYHLSAFRAVNTKNNRRIIEGKIVAQLSTDEVLKIIQFAFHWIHLNTNNKQKLH